ncbi:MAG: N-6 DNA methylase, partial [Lamprocystis purpurea]|nr:N-6 DNA methylase [Lamprocystis purpurea]
VATRRPLVLGVKVLDPACGSGAFLVQVYRRLIEQQLHGADTLSPATLSKLLTDHIFGIDQDEDACRVAALSLSLTLLDYVEPPDLRRFPDFKLPGLYGTNIVRGDFFAPVFPWPEFRFEWIVGNPPWVNLIPDKLLPGQEPAFAWMKPRQESHPTGGWQLAEAFLWKTLEHLHPDGAAGMLAPAMTLFKSQSVKFRAAFFSQVPVWCVANFSNLAYLLFARRAALPAAVLFFRATGEIDDSEDILSYAPFAVNQPTLVRGLGQRFREAWTLAINAGELRRVERVKAAQGDGLTWKLAMWGSRQDRRVLERFGRRAPTFRQFAAAHGLVAHQGVQSRKVDADEPVEFVQELVGKRRVLMKPLERRGRLYSFPESAIEILTEDNAFVRKRSGIALPLEVCRPT